MKFNIFHILHSLLGFFSKFAVIPSKHHFLSVLLLYFTYSNVLYIFWVLILLNIYAFTTPIYGAGKLFPMEVCKSWEMYLIKSICIIFLKRQSCISTLLNLGSLYDDVDQENVELPLSPIQNLATLLEGGSQGQTHTEQH